MTTALKSKFNNKSCKLEGCQGHMKWLVETLGPVILGAKPAEIISYPKFDCSRCEKKLQAIDSNFEKAIKVKYKKITQENGQIKILFFMIRFTCTKPFTIEGTDDSLFQWGTQERLY